MNTFWKKLRIVLLIIFLAIVAVGSYFLFGTFSDGYRSGTIIKFSHKGVLFKTYEGELNMGMIIGDNAAANYGANIFTFSVPSGNTEVIKKIEDAMLTGHRSKLFYKEKYFTFPWVGDTKYHIYNVDIYETSKIPQRDSLK